MITSRAQSKNSLVLQSCVHVQVLSKSITTLPIILVSPNVPETNKDHPFSDSLAHLQATPTDALSKVTIPAAGFNQASIFDAVSSMQVIISCTPVSSHQFHLNL